MTLYDQQQAWDEGYEAGSHDGYHDTAAQPNPYEQLIADRREFIREALEPAYGTWVDDNDEPILTDEVLDDLLDAHDDWLAQQRPCSAQFTIVHVDSKAADSAPCVRPGGHAGGHETETGRTWPQAPAADTPS